MKRIQRIEISFPLAVNLTDSFSEELDALLDTVCEQYERENPTRVMWLAGFGAKPLRQEPEEPEYDETIYAIDVAEREKTAGDSHR